MAQTITVKPVALVTGASAGIGKATVRRLLKDGWQVYAGARRVERMVDLLEEGAKVVPLDVTNDASMQHAVRTVLEAEQHIDALVNNAGCGSYGAVEDVPMAEARRQFEVNVFGAARLCQLVLPTMRERGSGTIVNISSVSGRIWMPVGGWYHASKHALEVLSDALRVETRDFGIRVVVVQPGAIESEFAAISVKNLQASSRKTVYGNLVHAMARRLGSRRREAPPEAVARVVAKAVNSSRPKRRYATPLHARALIFLRWLLPDALWEKLLASTIK
jgi:NAD(P)-dependent dehydrogenase (short-subunit alcohol dehydrogenase family)